MIAREERKVTREYTYMGAHSKGGYHPEVSQASLPMLSGALDGRELQQEPPQRVGGCRELPGAASQAPTHGGLGPYLERFIKKPRTAALPGGDVSRR